MRREGNNGAVKDKTVGRLDRRTGCDTNGAIVANRYSRAGRISPSPISTFCFCMFPSSVVKSRAKYAVAVCSVFCSSMVDSRASKRVAGVFWWGSDDSVCGRIFSSARCILEEELSCLMYVARRAKSKKKSHHV